MDYQELGPVQLTRLCAQRNSEAWLEFIRRYQRPITLVILRTLREAGGTSTLLIDDLVQETYAALCANDCRLLRDFVEEYPSSLDASPQISRMTISGHTTQRSVAATSIRLPMTQPR